MDFAAPSVSAFLMEKHFGLARYGSQYLSLKKPLNCTWHKSQSSSTCFYNILKKLFMCSLSSCVNVLRIPPKSIYYTSLVFLRSNRPIAKRCYKQWFLLPLQSNQKYIARLCNYVENNQRKMINYNLQFNEVKISTVFWVEFVSVYQNPQGKIFPSEVLQRVRKHFPQAILVLLC